MVSPELLKLEKKAQASVWTAAFLVALITFITYLPALQNGFVNWDDHKYILENPNIRSINPELLFSFYYSNWHPLTMLSYALDYVVWGLNPFGYHLANILFHAANTFLVFILTLRLIECGLIQNPKPKTQNFSLIAASITAFLFGIHPLHVESVAWISERKDVLCAFFYLSSLIAYLEYTPYSGSKRPIFYITSIIFFIMALMSKPMAVSLPIVLLILDFYPLNRLRTGESTEIKKIFIEKLPFFVLSFLSSVVAVWSQSSSGSVAQLEILPLIARIFIAVRTYIFYLLKMLLPNNLAPLYPLPVKINYFDLEYILSFILLLLLASFCLWSLKRNRVHPAVWLYYFVTLIPVIGIVKVGQQAAADRYTYLPSIGPFLLAGLGIAALLEKYPARRNRLTIIAILLLTSSILGLKTVRQISIWKDSITLWSYEIRLFPDSGDTAYYNRGLAYDSIGKYNWAIHDYNKAIALNPDYAEAYNNRGIAYDSEGNYDRAIKDFNKAIALNPDNAKAYNNRGIAYYNKGQYDRAIQDHNQSIALKPDFADAYNNRGTDYASKGQDEKAIQDYDKAIALNPDLAKAYNNRGLTYYNKGQYDRAISDLQKACNMGYEKGCNNYKKYSQLL